MRAASQSQVEALTDGIERLEFEHEDDAARDLTARAQLARAHGADLVVRADFTLEAEPPPTQPPAEPGEAPEFTRRLVTEFWVNDKKQRKVLPPQTALRLEVKVKVPQKGEIAADAPFSEPDTKGTTATLDVVVRSSMWAADQRQQISLPMERSDLPSSSAAFDFTTGPEGTVAEFDIIVSFRNRPLQAATLTAAVRAGPLPGERVRLLTHQLSSPDEPTPQLSSADVSLEASAQQLANLTTGVKRSIANAKAILDQIETIASQTLGVDDAPDDLDDARAVQLLVDLARKGHQLRDQLNGLGLDSATSIDLLVDNFTPIFPLELVYEGVTPRKQGARLCDHHRRVPPPLGETCAHTSTRRVCPYAFWGMHRTVTRTVRSDDRLPVRRSPQVRINDVLYAAAKQADFGSQPGAVPTQLLASAAQQLVGTTQSVPVSSWTEWRKQIGLREPALLVVLGHTQEEHTEMSILIGKTSFLAQADVSGRVVRKSDQLSPIVVLMACASGQEVDAFGNLPGTFVRRGAGAVVATLTKLAGRHGAAASREIMRALVEAGPANGSVGDALLAARRSLVANGLLLGLLLVNHGNVDTKVVA
jgi:hypothetical protein